MSVIGFLHIDDNGNAVTVTENGVGAPVAPIDLTEYVRSITVNLDDRPPETWTTATLRMYPASDDDPE